MFDVLQAGEAAKGAGKTYQRTTGRDAEEDSKVAGIVAVAGGTVLAAGVCFDMLHLSRGARRSGVGWCYVKAMHVLLCFSYFTATLTCP